MAKKNEVWGTVRSIFITVGLLMLILLGISAYVRFRSSVTVNDVDNNPKLRINTIFDDIKLVSHDDIFSYDMLQSELSDDSLRLFMQQSIKEGDTIVHVNNSVGIQSLYMAKLVGQAGRVYVYNPYEKYSDVIAKSAEANGYQARIKVETYAISNSSYDGLLVYKNNFPIFSGELFPSGHQVPAGYSALPVSVSSIDELLPNLQNVNYIRIGTPKCEKVLQGAGKLISRSTGVTIILDFPQNQDRQGVIDFANKFKFSMFVIQKDGTLEPAANFTKTGSYLVLKKS